MDNDRIKNVPLVSRDDIAKFNGLDGKVENLRETRFWEDKKRRSDMRQFRADREVANKIIALSAAVAIVGALAGVGAVFKTKMNDIAAEEEIMSQTIYNTGVESSNDEIRHYNPDDLLFDEIVYDIDGVGHRVVVDTEGNCSFVGMNYETPFQFLNGMACEDVARNMGFDFDSLPKNHTR